MSATFTRRHYKAIAEVIADAWNDGSGVLDREALLNGLSRYFKSDNPRFDRGRFYRACEPAQPALREIARKEAA